MAYVLDFPEAIKAFLRGLPLSRRGRLALYAHALDTLRQEGDRFRNDPNLRVAPGSQLFRYEAALVDRDGDGRSHLFVFTVDDSSAPYGVLQVVGLRHILGPPFSP
jgi:hypothetical protein